MECHSFRMRTSPAIAVTMGNMINTTVRIHGSAESGASKSAAITISRTPQRENDLPLEVGEFINPFRKLIWQTDHIVVICALAVKFVGNIGVVIVDAVTLCLRQVSVRIDMLFIAGDGVCVLGMEFGGLTVVVLVAAVEDTVDRVAHLAKNISIIFEKHLPLLRFSSTLL